MDKLPRNITGMIKHKELNFHNEGIQYVYEFDYYNNDGSFFCKGIRASVIMSPGSYGGKDGLWELGVFKYGEMWYNNPFTGDDAVKGYLTWEEVQDKLKEIEKYVNK